MLDTFKNILSTAHTFEEHELNYNYIHVILKNTASYLKGSVLHVKVENKLIWTKCLESIWLSKYCLLFHNINISHVYSRKKCPDLTPTGLGRGRRKKKTNHKITHTIQNLNKSILMIYRTGKPYLDRTLLSKKKKKIACIWQKGWIIPNVY